jgi:HD-GYP domain-containing protein (c-di-GMP phosphodiesterase class II)
MKTILVLLCALGAAAVVVVLSIATPGAIMPLSLRAYDDLLRAADRPPLTGRVSIVAVDEKSIAEIGQWPWRRDVMARLVERLHSLGAGVIAFDVILSEPDRFEAPGSPAGNTSDGTATANDAMLAAALEHPHAVTSYAFTFDPDARQTRSCILHPLRAVRIESSSQPPLTHRLFQPNGAICSLPAFNRAAGASGFLNVSRDADGVMRRVPMVMEYGGELYPSLALAAVQQIRGARLVTVQATGDRLTLRLAGQSIPLDAHGRLLIRFPGPGQTIRHVAASDVLEGRLPAGAFAEQIVFIGGTAVGVSDVVTTPLDMSYPGVEVHATAAEGLLGAHFVAMPANAAVYELVAAVAAALAVAVFMIVGGLSWAGLGTVLVSVLVWLLTSWAFETRSIFFSPVVPLLSASLAFGVLTVAKVMQERRRAESEERRTQQAYRFIVQSLTTLTEARDADTGRHARRTQGYTRLVASLLAKSPRFRGTLTRETIELMAILAPLHDIGKVGIPDAVLNKPGPLTPEELAQMRTHPRLGYNTIAYAEALSLIEDDEVVSLAKDMVLTHHEWWDGTGYPRGLAGEEIPVGGRILAVVDVYDALVAARPYRASMAHDQAVDVIRAERGTHFDPEVVDAFVAAEREVEALAKTLSS